jgi:membrane-associated phospholipid phosphatase
MALRTVALQVGVVVAALHLLGLLLVVGPARLRAGSRMVRSNVASVAPTLALLVVVLAVNGIVRDTGTELSWLIGINITGYIHALEGQLVARIQSVATPLLTTYFDFVYVFGYVFLLTFPLPAYLLHEDPRPLHHHLLAYVLNYGIGGICYVLFVAYGPRNFIPDLVTSLLYTSWPQSQLLTSEVNANTNVFPSLHASLSVAASILAYRHREIYPRWVPVAGLLAVSITISTMYLGIHWATDVVAGVALGALSVALASRIDDRLDWGASQRPGGKSPVARWVEALRQLRRDERERD